MAKTKRPETQNAGAATAMQNLIAYCNREADKLDTLVERSAEMGSYTQAGTLQSVARGIRKVASWARDWDLRAQAKRGGLGRKKARR